MENETLIRIAEALERMAPAIRPAFDIHAADAFVWQSESQSLRPVAAVSRTELSLLKGIEHIRDVLLQNTTQFANGFPANNALLWGARGMGKSSLIKAVHARVNQKTSNTLALIEIHREDIHSLPDLIDQLARLERRSLLFCDDLSFDQDDTSYKSLKAVLEGGIVGRPANILLYATSNRRHLMPRDMVENEQATAIHPSEAVEEKVSLSDRFGLWLGFHACDQETYFDMIRGYIAHYSLPIDEASWRAQAVEWSQTRGARSGRVAWQFIQDLAGRLKHPLRQD